MYGVDNGFVVVDDVVDEVVCFVLDVGVYVEVFGYLFDKV